MLTRTEKPEPIISLDEMKQDLRVRHDRDDGVIKRLIERAEGYLDGHDGILGRAMAEQEWVQYFPSFKNRLLFNLTPVMSIEKIEYYDSEDVKQTLTGQYELYHSTAGSSYAEQTVNAVFPAISSRKFPVLVTFKAGYGPPDDVPPAIRGAISMLVAHYYANPEASSDKPSYKVDKGVSDLIAPFRDWR